VIPPPRLLGQNFPLFHFMELAAKNRRLENSWNPTHGCARGRSRWSLPPSRLLRRGDLTSEIWQFRSTREMRRVGLAADKTESVGRARLGGKVVVVVSLFTQKSGTGPTRCALIQTAAEAGDDV
jgi:hypothetical protein